MDTDAVIFVAGARGLVGSAIVRRLEKEGYKRILAPGRSELDLMDGPAVARFFEREKPAYVFQAAAKVGGILANSTKPADFIHTNLTIQNNLIAESHRTGVRRLLFLGSSCIYPKNSPQPIKEEYLMTGPLEPTNSAYATAKIAGIEMCWAFNRQHGTHFLPVMPTNLFGPNDNFDLETSHVMPALIRKVCEAKAQGAKSVTVWGSGRPRREFLYVDDLADACVFLMKYPFNDDFFTEKPLINIGTGEDCTIQDLANRIKSIIDFSGDLVFDETKPDGTPVKRLDIQRLLDLGWSPGTPFEEGIKKTYEWYISQKV